MTDLPDNIVSLDSRRKKNQKLYDHGRDENNELPDFKEYDASLYIHNLILNAKEIFPEVDDRTWATWLPHLLESRKALTAGFAAVHQKAVYDPRFAIIFASMFADIAVDEFAKVAICGAIDRLKFDEAVYRVVKDFKAIDYFEGELP